METRIKLNKLKSIDDNMFGGWTYYSNHEIYNGRIVIIWREDWFKVEVKLACAQVVTCSIKYIPLHLEFDVTFVYNFNLKDERMTLWEYPGRHK